MLTVNNENTTKKINEITQFITRYQEPIIYSYRIFVSSEVFNRLITFIRKHSDMLNLTFGEKQINETAKKILFIVQEESIVNIEVIKKTIMQLTDKKIPLNTSGMLTQFIELYTYKLNSCV